MAYQKNFTTTYTINGHEYTVTAPALFDSNTNELIPDKKLDDQAAEIARQQYRDEMGLLSPKDLKQYRAKVGLSQRNLAELTGLSPNTIALYEAGAFPTKANNRMLKSLIINDNVLQQYITNDKNNYSDELVSKVNSYLSKGNDIIESQKSSLSLWLYS
ncbi:phage associated protein [Limosilactobacillus frumenti DSM 13145]|uniref:Phage associated protein n=1 Tax=Limosilactobacillus frumenti DSM 13145 TaxID=1423746 RepID=A0A0R1P986_9LACO|nr:helix-turn-helix domain-containing protein [Limosilactobacillus frumenti]KRL27220.1 phage associated protein [Limosilactobacillus frumenti DSM 13145]